MERKYNKIAKLNIRKNDMVFVIAGDDKDMKTKRRVIEVLPKEGKVLVEGVNIVSKHLKPQVNKDYPNGGIIKKEMPINISNVMLADASGNNTRVGRKLNNEGKLQRYSKKTGEFIK